MPKAFLLKYKKRCEYFGKRADEIGSCETSTEAINLKKTPNHLAEDKMVKGTPPLKKHQYHIQAYEKSDKSNKNEDSDQHDDLNLKLKEQKPEVEIMKIEKHEDQIPVNDDIVYNDMHQHIQNKHEMKGENEFISEHLHEDKRFLYQPLTPPSPKSSSSTAYASKLLQQLQIHRQNSSSNSSLGSETIFNGNNPLNQLAEISLAAAAAHATSTPNNSFDDGMKNSLAKQNIIANLMFPTILHHLQQQQQRTSEQEVDSSSSFVPTPSTTPSPPPAHSSPTYCPSHIANERSQTSALMEILNKPPLKPNPPVAHNPLLRTSALNDNPYGSMNRLQLPQSDAIFELPPPQTAPEDLSLNKIARKLNFRDTPQTHKDFFETKDLLTRQNNLTPQPQKVLLDNVFKTAIPQSLLDRSSVESRSSESSNTGQHECQDCGKVYSTSSNLARHRQTHRSLEDKKARKCPHCDKTYVSMPAYSMHIRTHNQGCKCPYCGKCFSRPWLLQGHVRTHTGEKPFSCHICEKTFADKSNLRAHIQTHSNTKPFVCQRCNKAFALKSYLYKHEESSCMRMLRSSSEDLDPSSPNKQRRRFRRQRSTQIVPNSDSLSTTETMHAQVPHELSSFSNNVSPRPRMELDQLNQRQLLLQALVASSTNGNNQQKQSFRQTPSPAPSLSSTASSSHGSSFENFRENTCRSFST